MESDLKVVERDVAHIKADLADFKDDQAKRWEQNRETHSDLYQRLDRLPPWATLFIAFLSALAGGAIMKAIG